MNNHKVMLLILLTILTLVIAIVNHFVMSYHFPKAENYTYIEPIGQQLPIAKLQHDTGDNYQVAILANNKIEWFTLYSSHVSGIYVDDNLKEAYIKRLNDYDDGAVLTDKYEIHIPKNFNIDAGQIQTGKNQYTQAQMIYGNQ